MTTAFTCADHPSVHGSLMTHGERIMEMVKDCIAQELKLGSSKLIADEQARRQAGE